MYVVVAMDRQMYDMCERWRRGPPQWQSRPTDSTTIGRRRLTCSLENTEQVHALCLHAYMLVHWNAYTVKSTYIGMCVLMYA